MLKYSQQQLLKSRPTKKDLKNLKRHPIYVILDNIRSALNVGAMFRTSDAARIEKLYLCGITCYPPHNKLPKTALSTIDTVPREYCKNTIEAIKKLRATIETADSFPTDHATDLVDQNDLTDLNGKKDRLDLSSTALAKEDRLNRLDRLDRSPTVISVELTKESVDYSSLHYKPPLALVFGHEINGVSEEALKLSDKIVKIPMYGHANSLNVATAYGIVLFEVLRQWREKGMVK